MISMRLRNAQREEDGREGSVEINKEKEKETGENKESQPVYYSSNAV